MDSQQAQNICITFVQCWTNVEDVGPMLYKCDANVFLFAELVTFYRFIWIPMLWGYGQSKCFIFSVQGSLLYVRI